MVSAFSSRFMPPEENHLHADKRSSLVIHNVSVRGHRTSIRLEPQIWNTLAEICRREFCTPHDVCSYVAERKPPQSSLTSWLRVFVLDYFRSAATEEGHRQAGHGQGMFMSQQVERREMPSMKGDVLEPKALDGLNRSPQRAGAGELPRGRRSGPRHLER